MSTEHQQYSTENQSEVIRQYSENRGMAIVRTYTDAGKSGLRIEGRDAAPFHPMQATLGHASIFTPGRYLHARPKDSSGRFLAL